MVGKWIMSKWTVDPKCTRQYKAASKPRLIALEPRMLFDGAALATVVDVNQTQQADTTSVEGNVSPELAAALVSVSSASDAPVDIDQNQIQVRLQ